MQEPSLRTAQKYLKTPLYELGPPFQTRNAILRKVVTAFGNMTLIWEKPYRSSDAFFKERKEMLDDQHFLGFFPLIYEQEIIATKQTPEDSACISLIEQVEVTDLNYHIKQIETRQLLLCAMSVQNRTRYSFQIQQYQLEHVLVSVKTKLKYFDFTKLCYKNENHSQQKCAQLFAEKLQKLLSIPKQTDDASPLKSMKLQEIKKHERVPQQGQSLDEVIIVKDKVYRPSYPLISKAIYWFQLVVWLNLIPKTVIKVVKPQIPGNSPQKIRESPVWKLNGSPEIIYELRRYRNFVFIDGKCINIMQEVSVQQMRLKFFRKNILYVVERSNNTVVKKYEQINSKGFGEVHTNDSQQSEGSMVEEQMGEGRRPMNTKHVLQPKLRKHFTLPLLPDTPYDVPTDTIVIEENVPKIECINFFITYLNYISPVLYSLQYFPTKNSLRLHLKTKVNPRIIINLIFHPTYILKDQEISMVLEKCSLEKCSLLIRQMSITDSLLLFLANSEKMKHIIKIDFSGCDKISENGVNSLLISPYCKNLEEIDLSELPLSETAIETIAYKLKKLVKLKINNCVQNFEGISLGALKLKALEALGLNIQMNFSDTISVLKIDSEVDIESLKSIKNLILLELKMKLVETKKNIMNVFGNFYKETNPAKLFADGPSRKSLKVIDFSHSSVKMKTLKPIFNMQTLETLILEHYEKMGTQFEHVSPKLLNLSLSHSPVTISNLSNLLSRTPHLISLNITKTDIKKQEIIQYLFSYKKHVNTIQVSEEQYTNKLLDKEKSVVECIKVHVIRLLNHDSQYVFNHMLFKVSQSNKTVFLLSPEEGVLLMKVKKYLANACAQPPKNIHINDKPYYQIKENKLPDSHSHQFIQCDGFKIKKWASDEPIDSLTYHFVRALREFPDHLLGVYLYANKVIGPEAIEMISAYGANRVRWIDFRKCLFHFSDMSSTLFDFPFLEKVNEGSYEILLNGKNFVEESQKYLKFFMRIANVNSLDIEVHDVREAEILYSVLYHIVDHHSLTLYELSISLSNARISPEAINFWSRLFELRKLRSLKISIQACEDWSNIGVFDNLNEMRLQKLELYVPSQSLPILQIQQLHSLTLFICDQSVSDSSLGKMLRYLPSLTELNLNCDRCAGISNLGKLSCISKFSKLQTLQLSLEYCNLKENTLFEFIESLRQLKSLHRFELNVSFTTQNWNDLLKSIESLKQALNNTYIKIIAVKQQVRYFSQTSKDYVFNREELTLKGVQIVM